MSNVAYCGAKFCKPGCNQYQSCTLSKKSQAFVEKIKTINISSVATPTRNRGKYGKI
jgi:hypothetical protein